MLSVSLMERRSAMNVHPQTPEAMSLAEKRSYASLVAEHTRDSVVVTDVHGLVKWVNPAFERLSGFTLDDMAGEKPGAFLQGPDTDPATVRHISRRLAERAPVKVDLVNYTKAREPYWIEMDIAPVFDDEGRHTAFVAIERDISERKSLILEMEKARAVDQRRRTERRVIAEMSEWLYAADSTEELCAIVKEAMPQLVNGGTGTLFIYRNSRDRLEPLASWGDELPPANIIPTDCWALRRGHTHTFGGQLVNVACPHRPAVDDAGERMTVCIPLLAHGETLGLLHIAFPDLDPRATLEEETRADFEETRQLLITSAKQIGLAIANVRLRAELRAHATRDVLTGLPNRRWFLEAARNAVSDALSGRSPVALLSLDVDHFKAINDTYGHAAGDAVLRALAVVMNDVVGSAGTACRIGGEEFVVLLPGADMARAATVAETLRKRIAERRDSEPGAVPAATISIGIASAPGHARSTEELLERADEALYRAKREGRDRVATVDDMAP